VQGSQEAQRFAGRRLLIDPVQEILHAPPGFRRGLLLQHLPQLRLGYGAEFGQLLERFFSRMQRYRPRGRNHNRLAFGHDFRH
jgi:hypothetical protein